MLLYKIFILMYEMELAVATYCQLKSPTTHDVL